VALTGTLEDFGIAEILQLIGQQAKSGVLHLRSREDEIHVGISGGYVVRAESAGRKARERLGSMMLRAELLTREQLDRALEEQRRTLRRLGDLLVELGMVSREQLREMTALQTTETIYQLFRWKSGTYAFEPGDVEWDRETVAPLRAEAVLMEGFRRVDEWPLVRKRISSPAMTFERRRAPTAEPGRGRAGPEHAADPGGAEGGGTAEVAGLGENERRTYALAVPGRTVEQIVDLSRLGEFEACKALATLCNLGYLEARGPARRPGAVGAYAQGWRARVRAGLGSVLATVVIAAALAGIAWLVDARGLAWGAPSGAVPVRDDAAHRFVARYQLERLRGALEVYRLERGEYPAALDALVEAGLVAPADLRLPGAGPAARYHYRRAGEARFVLLPPVE
jgi:hypothetical protein